MRNLLAFFFGRFLWSSAKFDASGEKKFMDHQGEFPREWKNKDSCCARIALFSHHHRRSWAFLLFPSSRASSSTSGKQRHHDDQFEVFSFQVRSRFFCSLSATGQISALDFHFSSGRWTRGKIVFDWAGNFHIFSIIFQFSLVGFLLFCYCLFLFTTLLSLIWRFLWWTNIYCCCCVIEKILPTFMRILINFPLHLQRKSAEAQITAVPEHQSSCLRSKSSSCLARKTSRSSVFNLFHSQPCFSEQTFLVQALSSSWQFERDFCSFHSGLGVFTRTPTTIGTRDRAPLKVETHRKQ